MPRVFILTSFLIVSLFADYYRLENYDTSYHKLDEEPLPPSKDKDLHPSSIYKYNRPSKAEKQPQYSRNEIPKNNQAINRYYTITSSPRVHYFLVGINSGLDLYAFDEKRQLSIEVLGKIGYAYYFYKKHHLRTYFQAGGRFPLNNKNPTAIALSVNFDIVVNFKYFDIYGGLGYGGEYYSSQSFFANGVNINLGLSKSFNTRHSIDVGIVIPFYSITINDRILKNNIDFIIAYNYKL